MHKKCAQKSLLQKRLKETKKFLDMGKRVRISKISSTPRQECSRTTMRGLNNHVRSLRLGVMIEMMRVMSSLETASQRISMITVEMKEITKTL